MVRVLRPRTWPLRLRLLGAVAALGIGLCVAVSTGTLVAMQTYLINQLDGQVSEAKSRSRTFFEMGQPPFVRFTGPGPLFLDGPGQSVGTVGAVESGNVVTEAAFITASGNREALNETARRQLAEVPIARTSSIELDGVGRYRVTAERIDADTVIISGLPLAGAEETLTSAAWIIGGFSLLALTGTVAVGTLIIRRELVPLSRMSLAAENVARLPLDRGEVRLPTPIEPVDDSVAHTEVGRLGTAFNLMVDRVAEGLTARHASEMRVRQFVADASHELRTPLASIQGYTEFAQRLVDDSAGASNLRSRDDLAHALSRVSAESRRMGHLVDDMLLLARLDAGRPLERDDVDLSELVVDAVSDAHIAGPDHRWGLEVPDEPVTVIGDRSRLQQALANLLSNARVHTPSGTRIVTSLADHHDGTVTMCVADDGPGIPDSLRPNVFERFARGDGSRSRSSGSTGLGLAITRAVVKAHNGIITVESSPAGTAFRMELPARPDVSRRDLPTD
ncbi:HAMP domain-containing sensor histidine kinase [Mycobacterium sp. 852002-51961_SCH5331710]|uniref:sensor histidine kinase n=1 Tax=Mycobacterium sp. 852002-51961_SCH5331710 TaxID=1834105 RepID=UPI000A724DEB|nr:HAMP domain-containing sensor histidine kinase [Mycobacterium sp. 852002-51961_SCH5331710]